MGDVVHSTSDIPVSEETRQRAETRSEGIVSLYTETISSAAQAPAVIHQAVAASYGGRGVAHLTIPQDVFEAKAEAGVSSIATLKPRPEIVPSEDEIKPPACAASRHTPPVTLLRPERCKAIAIAVQLPIQFA